MFKRIEYKVLELEKPTKLPELTTDLREALKILPQVPAFNYLMQRLNLEKAIVRNRLEEGATLASEQLRFLQGVAYGLSFIKREVNVLTKNSESPRAATNLEEDRFKEISQYLELVS